MYEGRYDVKYKMPTVKHSKIDALDDTKSGL